MSNPSQAFQTPAIKSQSSWISRFAYWHEVVLAGLLLGLFLFAWKTDPVFVALDTQIEKSRELWELAILTIPMTLIIITSGIDLSVGSMIALSAAVLGMTYKYGWVGLLVMRPQTPHGLPIWLCATLALAAGTLTGACNGLFIVKLRVHPLLVTLATLAAFKGVAEGVSLGEPVSQFPDAFQFLGQGSILGQPVAGFIFLALAIVAAVVLIKTPFGWYLYAMGHNEKATRFSGASVDRFKFLLYTLSGSAAGLAALILVARHNTAKADFGDGIELDVITAVVLGGTSIFGGRGNILGTVLGVLLVHETREFVPWHWNKSEYNSIVIGMLLIGSVLLNRLLSVRRRGS